MSNGYDALIVELVEACKAAYTVIEPHVEFSGEENEAAVLGKLANVIAKATAVGGAGASDTKQDNRWAR